MMANRLANGLVIYLIVPYVLTKIYLGGKTRLESSFTLYPQGVPCYFGAISVSNLNSPFSTLLITTFLIGLLRSSNL